jgi:hypothetical protein
MVSMSANTVHPPKPFTRSSGGQQSVFTALKHIKHLLVLALVSLLLVGCGGGSGGGFQDEDNVLRVQIYPVDGGYEMPWNPTLAPFDTRQPFTKNIRVEVRDHRNQLFPAEAITVDIAPSGEHGNLFTPIPPGDDLEDAGPFSRAVLEDTSGLAELFFVSNNKPGTVTLTASVLDPASERLVSATLTLNVVGQTLPVTSLTFTGPFINAVRAGLMATAITPGEAILQDGSYQRVVSAIATDENGNPPLIGTPIDFYLVDGPLVGYPAQGSGNFAISGNDGNPEEGGIIFRVPPVPGGGFAGPIINGPAVRPLNDRLVLDGRQEQNPGAAPNPNNRIFTGLWRIELVLDDNTLTIEQDPAVVNPRRFPSFPLNPANADTGPTVPYIIGSAQHGTILRTASTNDTGVASTLLTYPVFRLGQTAVLLACTRPQDLGADDPRFNDRRVCGILNTCDVNGENCNSVYLPISDGTNVLLTASPTELGPNTTTPLTLCLRDENFTPIPGGQIRYNVDSFLGSAKVFIRTDPNEVAGLDIDGTPSDLAGALPTGGDGCVTAFVRSTGQAPGTDPIKITFNSDGVAEAVEVEIQSPGAGNLSSSLNCTVAQCDATSRCTVDLLLTDDRGGRISGVLVTASGDGAEVSFPGGGSGTTDENGQVVATVTYQTGAPSVEFYAGSATEDVQMPACENDGGNGGE